MKDNKKIKEETKNLEDLSISLLQKIVEFDKENDTGVLYYLFGAVDTTVKKWENTTNLN